MATTNAATIISVPAGADLSTHQFKFVKLNSSKQVVIATAAGEKILGVLYNKPDAAGKAAQVAIFGKCKVKYGAAAAVGDAVSTDASAKGRASTAAATGTSVVDTSDAGAATDPVKGAYIMGICMEAATADGDVCETLITHSGAIATTAV